MNRLYLRLTNDLCEFNSNTSMWRIRLPSEFTNSTDPNKRINVLSFMFFNKFKENTANVSINQDDYTSFHSPTLCDGNFNQDNYICTLCYTQNTIAKTYSIKSNPQYVDFYFKDGCGELIEGFFYFGNENNGYYEFTKTFNIDLELIY